MQINKKIGQKIKTFRQKLGLQANKLAEQLNISPSYLNLIENGKRNIDADLLLKVCQELRIELSKVATGIGIEMEASEKSSMKLPDSSKIKIVVTNEKK